MFKFNKGKRLVLVFAKNEKNFLYLPEFLKKFLQLYFPDDNRNLRDIELPAGVRIVNALLVLGGVVHIYVVAFNLMIFFSQNCVQSSLLIKGYKPITPRFSLFLPDNADILDLPVLCKILGNHLRVGVRVETPDKHLSIVLNTLAVFNTIFLF